MKKFFKRWFGKKKRTYKGAGINRLTHDWTTTSKSADLEIYANLSTLRSRCRELCRNNDHAKKFMILIASDVVGSKGVRLQVKTDREEINKKVEEAWKEWGKKANASVTRQLSFMDIQRMALQSIVRDGEILIRKVTGFDNPFRFALQLLEADHLDEKYNTALTGDRKIKMGIELNKWEEPVAYHVFEKHPGDNFYTTLQYGERERVSADEMLHLFMSDRPGQKRGISWFHTAMYRLHMLEGYEEAELVASRAGAAKMGFFESEHGFGMAPADDTDSEGNLITEAEPGTFHELPPGVKLKEYSPDHPKAGFDAFVKGVLRGAASGLGCSYHSLSSDLTQTSYSSMRQGSLEERDFWRLLQEWLVEHLLMDVFSAWLPVAIISGQLEIPSTMIDIVMENLRWQPKRWAWIDPLKEQKANSEAIDKGLRSRTELIIDQGGDLEETFQNLAEEQKLAEKLGIQLKMGQGDQGGPRDDNESIAENVLELVQETVSQ